MPYAIIGISVITALLPRMSAHATDRRYSLVRDDVSTGVRLSSVIVAPAALLLAVLGAPLTEFLFSIGHSSTTVAEARYIGEVFGLFSLGLANISGAVASWHILSRRLGGLEGHRIAGSLLRMHGAAIPAMIFAWATTFMVGVIL